MRFTSPDYDNIQRTNSFITKVNQLRAMKRVSKQVSRKFKVGDYSISLVNLFSESRDATEICKTTTH